MGFANQDLTRGSMRADNRAIHDFCAAPGRTAFKNGEQVTGGIEQLVPHLPEVRRRIDDLAGERPAAGTTGP
jgi:hypothetical protein